MGFPCFPAVNAIKSPVTLSKHLKRKLSHQVGGKVSWIVNHRSVNIISCIYAAQGISQDPVVGTLQAFITSQAHRHAAQVTKLLCSLKEQGSHSKNPDTFSHGRNTLFSAIVLWCKDHLNANDSPKGLSNPALSGAPFSFTIISFKCPRGGRRDPWAADSASTSVPSQPSHLSGRQLASSSSWNFLDSVLCIPHTSSPSGGPTDSVTKTKQNKTSHPLVLVTAQVFKLSSCKTRATTTPSKLALREGHSHLQQRSQQATALAGWQLSLPAFCNLRRKMQILHGGPHSPQEPRLLSAYSFPKPHWPYPSLSISENTQVCMTLAPTGCASFWMLSPRSWGGLLSTDWGQSFYAGGSINWHHNLGKQTGNMFQRI